MRIRRKTDQHILLLIEHAVAFWLLANSCVFTWPLKCYVCVCIDMVTSKHTLVRKIDCPGKLFFRFASLFPDGQLGLQMGVHEKG